MYVTGYSLSLCVKRGRTEVDLGEQYRLCAPMVNFLEDNIRSKKLEFGQCSIFIPTILLSEKPVSRVRNVALHLRSAASMSASCQHRV